MRGASAQISRELNSTLAGAGKQAGATAGKNIGTGITAGVGRASKESGGLLANIEKGAAVSGTGYGKRFGSAMHETIGEYAKSIGVMMVGFMAFEKVKDIFGDIVEGGREVAQQQRLTNSVIASTGGVAGITATHVEELGKKLGDMAGVDDILTIKAENLMLTFRNVRNEAGKGNDVFDRAATASVNMGAALAAASGGAVDYRSAVTMVGKALGDPIRGMTAMSRVGVVFTQQQKDQVKTLVTSGHALDAQKIILKELETEYGGAAKAMRDPMTAAQAQIKELEAEIGGHLLPILGNLAEAGATGTVGLVHGIAAIPGPVKEATVAFLALKAAQSLGLGSALGTGMVAVRGRVLATAGSVRLLGSDVALMGRTWMTAGAMSTRESAAMAVSTSRLAAFGKGAAVLGGVALLASGAAEKMHLTNTASLALAGAMVGPLGAAAGATVGAFLDVRSATGGIRDALDESGGSVDELTKKLHDLQTQTDSISNGNRVGGGLKDAFGGNWISKARFIPIIGSYIAGLGHAKTATDLMKESTAATQKKLAGLTGAQRTAAAAAGAYGKSAQNAAKKMQAEQKAAGETAAKFITLGKSLNDSKVSLNGWIRQLARQAQALTQFGNNAQRAANKGLRDGLIKQLDAAGPAGAMRMRQLANASKTQIGAANRAWNAGQHAIKNYSDTVTHVPAAHLKVVSGPALAAVDVVRRAIADLHDKTVTITTRRFNQTVEQHLGLAPGQLGGAHADGGRISGPGGPRDDRIAALVSNGEFIVNAAATARNLPLLYRMNAQKYASGGQVKHNSLSSSEYKAATSSFDLTGAMSMKQFAAEVHTFVTQIRRDGGHLSKDFSGLRVSAKGAIVAFQASKVAIGREKAQRDSLIEAQSSLASTVAGNLTTDPFGKMEDFASWDIPDNVRQSFVRSSILTTLHDDISSAEQFGALSKSLKNRGLSKGALASVESEGIGALSAVAGMSDTDVKQYQHLFDQRAALVKSTSRDASGQAYGQLIKASSTQLKEMRAESKRQDKRIERLENALQHAVHGFAKEINHAAASAVRRGK